MRSCWFFPAQGICIYYSFDYFPLQRYNKHWVWFSVSFLLLIYWTFRTMWIQSFLLIVHMISTLADYEPASVSRTRTSYKLQKRNPQHWQSRQTDRRSGRCELLCKKGILNCKIWNLSSSVQHPPIFQRSLWRWRWNWGSLLHRGGVHWEGQNFIIFCLFVKDVC